MSVPAEVLQIVRQDELERTHEVKQSESQGPFYCYRCIFRKNPEVTLCGHPEIIRIYNGQIAPKECCDYYKLDPEVVEQEAQLAKRYTAPQALKAWARWAFSGERFDRKGHHVKDGPYARNILELAVSYEDHEKRKLVTPEMTEAYGERRIVDPQKVASGQHRLSVDRILQYMLDPETKPTAGPHGLDGRLPVVMLRRDGLSMVDGNHRMAAAVLRGEKTFEVICVNMNRAEHEKFARVVVFTEPPSWEDLVQKKNPYHVHAVADKYRPMVKRAVAHAFNIGRATVGRHVGEATPSKRAAKTVGDLAIADVREELERALPAMLERIATESGVQAYAKVRTRPKLKKRWQFWKDDGFDAKHPRMRKWIQDHTGELIDGIDDTTREEIAELIEDAFADESPTRKELSDLIAEAIGDDDRAELIAHTETMRAANKGQREAWQQAQEDGYLEEGERRTWIVTDDDHLCEDCEPMDGEEAALDEDYDGDGGDGPPLHPDCRCTEGLA